MAQRVQILLEDDVDGGTAEETVAFSLDGKTFEIDLSSSNAQKLRSDIEKWVTPARKIKATRIGRPSTFKTRIDPATPVIRKWAQGQGINVPDRGRVSKEVREQYYAAHPAEQDA